MVTNLPKPISSTDYYLSAIADPDRIRDMPRPISQLDYYLRAIAERLATSSEGGTGGGGKNIELEADDNYIKWRYIGDVAWTNLVALDDLKGSFDPNQTFGGLQTTAKTIVVAINEIFTTYLPLSGGAMKGDISQPKGPTLANHLANKDYVDKKVADLVGSAPGTLNTLEKLAAALAADANLSTTLMTMIGDKLDASEVVSTPQANKVLRMDGNGDLPTNITGNAVTASKFKNPVKVNGKIWYGNTDIDISADASLVEWEPNKDYEADDFVFHDDLIYRANTKHTSSANFKDDMKPGTEKWRVIGSGEDVGGIKQLTKLSVIAPVTLEIPISKTLTFARPPVEVLKLTPGSKDVVTTLCAFDNADADDFVVGGENGETARFVEFDGMMRPKTVYDVAMSTPAVMGERYYSESEEIDFADYKAVEELE